MWAGYYRGWRETIAMRVADVIMSFPSLLLAVVVLYVFSPSAANIVLVLAITRIPVYLRTARAESAELSSRVFVDAARTFGASGGSIITRHVLPIVLPTLLTVATLDFCYVMLAESSLSFLGIGIQPPDVSWGLMVAQGRTYLHTAWWLSFFPGLAIVITTVSATILAAWARIATDPAQRWRLTVPQKRLSRFTKTAKALSMTAVAEHPPAERVDADPALRVEGLTVDIRTITGTVRAVDQVSFAAHRGETLALLGESGCGKSMTATALVGLLEPVAEVTSGSARLADVDLLAVDRKKRRQMAGTELAIVFQDALTALNPLYTVGTQLAEPFRIHHGMKAKEARRKAVELMARVGIPQPEERLNSYPHQFSGGMRQRLLIAMAVALNPRVLIADEPTTALDVTVQAQIMALLKSLRAEYDMAVVLITHDLALVAEEADRVAVMYAGNIVETGTVAEVFADPKHPYTKGLLNSVPVNAERGAELKSIGGAPPDLALDPGGLRLPGALSAGQRRLPHHAALPSARRHQAQVCVPLSRGGHECLIKNSGEPTKLLSVRDLSKSFRVPGAAAARASCARSTGSTSTWPAARPWDWSANPVAASPHWRAP